MRQLKGAVLMIERLGQIDLPFCFVPDAQGVGQAVNGACNNAVAMILQEALLQDLLSGVGIMRLFGSQRLGRAFQCFEMVSVFPEEIMNGSAGRGAYQ